jgi:Protein of unknown function (DUF2798)
MIGLADARHSVGDSRDQRPNPRIAMQRLPHHFQPLLFGLFLSGFMSLIVSGIATLRAIGIPADFLFKWLTAWAGAWAVAFPAVLVVAPLVRRLVARMTLPPG